MRGVSRLLCWGIITLLTVSPGLAGETSPQVAFAKRALEDSEVALDQVAFILKDDATGLESEGFSIRRPLEIWRWVRSSACCRRCIASRPFR